MTCHGPRWEVEGDGGKLGKPGTLQEEHFGDLLPADSRAALPVHGTVRQGRLYDRKTPLVAADLLNDRVITFFDEHQIPSCLLKS